MSHARDSLSMVQRDIDIDDLASILAVVISSTRTAEEIRDGTGVVSDDVQPAVAHLARRGIIRDIGDGHYHASQTSCAGSCERKGSDVRGQEVVIAARTLRWTCAACWDAEVERNRSIASSGDKP